jgi:putative ABC transport system ATP-binding protein
VDLDVKRGEVLGIVGPSGSGKSTLLHLLGGLDAPSQGTVQLDGVGLYEISSAQRAWIRNQKIGFVFQSYQLLPELDAVENVQLPARLGHAANDDENRATELLTAVGLGERLHHLPMELSGGEQQRVAIARALMNRPSLILADEPTGNLDTQTGGMILELLLRLRTELGATLVLVTHDGTIAQHCTRTLHMVDGKLTE